MDMRKKLYMLAILVALGCTACHKSTRIFDISASQRTEEALENYRSALVGRGTWVMEFFPDEQLRYGGWVYVMEFRPDGIVKVWFEGDKFVPQSNPVTESEYVVELGTGPMLKFRTNNDYIHFFSFPGGANGGGYQGWGGDYEFTLMSMSDNYDEIVLKGLRSFNRSRMFPLPGGVTPEEYIASVKASDLAVTRTSFDLCVNGQVIGTATRESAPALDNFNKFYKSKVWTLSYMKPVQKIDENGNAAVDESGAPVYENVAVNDRVCAINLPGGVMKLYEPYAFQGNIIEGLDGQVVSEFKWEHGVFSSLDYYSGTDSFYQIVLQ